MSTLSNKQTTAIGSQSAFGIKKKLNNAQSNGTVSDI